MLLMRSFGVVDYKVQEAEYFLSEIKQLNGRPDFAGMQFRASAFTSAARSITFAMQASLKGHPSWEGWYGPRQKSLRDNPLARFFHDFRTVTQHLGVNVVGAGSGDRHGHLYWFVPHPDLPHVPEQDVASACESYFLLVLGLVYDCYIHFGPVIDGQQRFTAEYFASIGKTIEDAERELGLPQGWTDIGDPAALPWRWEVLRKSADGCLIASSFQRWLDKELPQPEPLPPYEPTPR